MVHEEQGVVYLFSRYWDKIKALGVIDHLEGLYIQFPDGEYRDKKENLGAIEFKYKKSGFLEYLKSRKRSKSKKSILWYFRNGGYNDYVKNLPLVGIYWIDDKLTERQQKKLDYYGVKLINLSKHFEPTLKKGKSRLSIFLQYKKTNLKEEEREYYKDFGTDLNKLIKEMKKVEKKKRTKLIYRPNKGTIRILGHDPKRANDLDIRYWNLFKIYTTTSELDVREGVPFKFFFKPNSEDAIVGYFKPKCLFSINESNRENKLLLKFYQKYYSFPPFDEEYGDGYCVIYKNFQPLEGKRGEALFNKIKKQTGKSWQNKGIAIKKDEYPTLFRNLRNI